MLEVIASNKGGRVRTLDELQDRIKELKFHLKEARAENEKLREMLIMQHLIKPIVYQLPNGTVLNDELKQKIQEAE